jgi:hypothetical protein
MYICVLTSGYSNHVDQDLQPYICLFPECAEALIFFSRQHEWKTHMEEVHSLDWPQKVHSLVFYCDLGHEGEDPPQFANEAEWRKHMEDFESHSRHYSKIPTETQLTALAARKQQLVLRERYVCPLCNNIPPNIQLLVTKADHSVVFRLLTEHIVQHIKALSLMSLSCLDDISQEQDRKSSRSNPRVPSQSSSIERISVASLDAEHEINPRTPSDFVKPGPFVDLSTHTNMRYTGVLGELEKFNARTHKTVLSLGCRFGQFESWLQNKNVPDSEIDKKCAALAEDINDDLEWLDSEYRITMVAKSKRRLRQGAFNEIEKIMSRQSPSHGVYFMIGTALGLLYHGMEELAAIRLKGIGEYHETMKVESEHLFKHLRDTAIPLNGRSSEALVTDVIIMLQRLLRDIVILFITSDPRDAGRLFIGQEQEALLRALESIRHGANYKVEIRGSCELDNLHQDIIRFRPQIIHFAGHAGDEGLCFRDKNQQIKLVMATKLAGILEMAAEDGLRVVVLNACSTSSQCDGIASKVESVIAMRGLVGDDEAISFSRSFYYALGMGKPVANAFNSALASCSLMDRPELIRPILIQNGQQGDVKTSDTPSTSLAAISDAQAPVLDDDSLDGHTLIDESDDASVDGAQQNVSDSEEVVICGDTVENGEGGKVEEIEIIDLNSENMTAPEVSATRELYPVSESDKNEVTNDKDEGQDSSSSKGATGDEDEKEDRAASGTERLRKGTEGSYYDLPVPNFCRLIYLIVSRQRRTFIRRPTNPLL